MKLSIQLHPYIVDTLKMYGELDDVVNKILDASEEGHFDVSGKPDCEDRQGCSRYEVRIRNETYLSMLKVHGVRSKNISLRRLIYWFVDNEMYDQLEWEPVREYVNRNDAKINKVIDRLLCDLNKLEYLTNKTFDDIREQLNDEWRS